MKYVKGFDTLRAIAVLIVILGHWGLPFAANNAINDLVVASFSRYGGFGVILFFVLSGFLITSILLIEKNNGAAGSHMVTIKNFYARRTLRIFPIYYLVVFIFFFLVQDPFIRNHIWYFITYTSNLLPYQGYERSILNHTWSLAVEEQFYLIWPWLIIFVNNKYLKHLLLGIIIIGIVSKYIVLYPLHKDTPDLVFNAFDSFGLGAIYALIRRDTEQCKKFERNFIVLLPFLLYIQYTIVPVRGTALAVMYYRTLESFIGLACIMFVLKTKSAWVKKYILENRIMNFLGKISYGIYLYHLPFGIAFDKFMTRMAATHPNRIFTDYYAYYPIKFAILILICWVSFKLIEQPIMRLKRKFEYPVPPTIK